jgi:hypothetical protein
MPLINLGDRQAVNTRCVIIFFFCALDSPDTLLTTLDFVRGIGLRHEPNTQLVANGQVLVGEGD